MGGWVGQEKYCVLQYCENDDNYGRSLRDQAHNVAAIKHSLDMIKKAVSFLNPTQSHVVTIDQPLFALANQIKWNWPNQYG